MLDIRRAVDILNVADACPDALKWLSVQPNVYYAWHSAGTKDLVWLISKYDMQATLQVAGWYAYRTAIQSNLSAFATECFRTYNMLHLAFEANYDAIKTRPITLHGCLLHAYYCAKYVHANCMQGAGCSLRVLCKEFAYLQTPTGDKLLSLYIRETLYGGKLPKFITQEN